MAGKWFMRIAWQPPGIAPPPRAAGIHPSPDSLLRLARVFSRNLRHHVGSTTHELARKRTYVRNGPQQESEGTIVDDKRRSIKRSALRARRQQPRKRPDPIAEALISFDFEERRIVAGWAWLDIQVVDVPNGARINIRPTLLLFSISYN